MVLTDFDCLSDQAVNKELQRLRKVKYFLLIQTQGLGSGKMFGQASVCKAQIDRRDQRHSQLVSIHSINCIAHGAVQLQSELQQAVVQT